MGRSSCRKSNKAGQFIVRGRVLGSDLTTEFSVRVTDKLGEVLSENPDYDENGNQALLQQPTILTTVLMTV